MKPTPVIAADFRQALGWRSPTVGTTSPASRKPALPFPEEFRAG